MQTAFQSLITIGVVALATFFTRVLPFILFPATKKTPQYIVYLGRVLPFAVIGMLIVYCLKSVSPVSYPFALPEIISILFIVVVHKWKHNTLISIGGGTVLYMLLIRLFFVK